MHRADWVQIVLVLHVLGAILGLGTNLTYGLIGALGERAGGGGRVFALRAIQSLDRRLANPAYMAQLVTGLLLVWLLKLDLFATSWLVTGVGLYVLVAVLGITVYGPVVRRQVALAEQLEAGGDPIAVGYAAVARRSAVLGIAVTLIVVAIVVLMVVQPTLW